MATLNSNELNEAIREVLKRTVVDSDFRTKAVADGNAAIVEVSGKSLPSNTSIAFVSNAGVDEKVIVLPDPITDANLLTEEELEEVAGGLMSGCTATSCAITS
jgi:hypothetical protein